MQKLLFASNKFSNIFHSIHTRHSFHFLKANLLSYDMSRMEGQKVTF
ncbi:hypothetical protein HMPREF3226_02451 [Prevotella corporis]|uniref:Uncharacterized protein n=1 Tax=Prevotella corporis TaxID=28128 RepID=A0A133PVL4_9BACT|nr:hypothetical protein HMPREF3226_02451 [Prevotella corporis]